jgi:mannose-6-phosphate isomerase-like protein (cupin superfamily)
VGVRRHLVVVMFAVVAAGRIGLAQQPHSFVVKPSAKQLAQTARAAKRQAEQLRKRIDFIPASTADATFRSAFTRGSPGRVLGTTLLTSGDEQTNFELVRRKVSGNPEVHARWDDLMIIRSGTGAIITGDSLVGSAYRAPGERAGGHFNKSYEIVLHAGDVIRIPAAVPHEVVVSGNQPLEYLLIKQRRQELPIRWYATR